MHRLLFIGFSAFAIAQQIGHELPEVHPKLSWKQCSEGGCKTVNGEIVIDSHWRWLHEVNGWQNCFQGNTWNYDICPTKEECTENCALEGAAYEATYGIVARNDTVSMRYKTDSYSGDNVNSRIFLMEDENTYKTFTLLGNEIAVDVNVSTVECGLNAAFYFVAMEQDGGKASFPTNKAGAKYGTGYCDATCSRSVKFNGGLANSEGWEPSPYDQRNGQGYEGSCCAEFAVLNSNAYSYLMSSKPCIDIDYHVCEGIDCGWGDYPRFPTCDRWGCEYQPHRLGNTGFYGHDKVVDTTRPFTVVTQFAEDKVSQFFIQDGEKIEVPNPGLPDFAPENGLTAQYCREKTDIFHEYDQFEIVGGFGQHLRALQQPMVLAMSISDDHWGHHLWLDSTWYPDQEGQPGAARGPCRPASNAPAEIEVTYPRSTAVWSNIRFGPIGTTV